MTIEPGHAEPNEFPPFFAAYMTKTQAVTDPIAALETQMNEVLELLKPLDDAKQRHRYADGKWSIKEMVNHFTDAERVFSYRVMRIARNDKTPLAPFEENAYVAAAQADEVAWQGLLGEFELVRRSSLQLLRNLPKEAWIRMGIASGHPMSVRAMVFIMYGHVAHHLGILRERYL